MIAAMKPPGPPGLLPGMKNSNDSGIMHVSPIGEKEKALKIVV